MTVQYLLETTPAWIGLKQEGPEPLVSCCCTVLRNLSDFVFPVNCSDDERRAAELRIMRALNQCNGIPTGRYHPVSDMNGTYLRLLAERRLITYELLCASGPRGVYIADDQTLSVMVNSTDHIAIRATLSGGLDEAWRAVCRVDDGLGATLNFTYHERLGYLTSALRTIGTGLKIGALLHLPALALSGRIKNAEELATSRGLVLRGLALGDPRGVDSGPSASSLQCGVTPDIEPVSMQSLFLDMLGDLAAPPVQSVGNLFLLVNQDTLGVSERELIIHGESTINEIVQYEEDARQRLLREHRNTLLDCFGRALGILRGARLLNLREAFQFASLIRLADAMRLVVGCDRTALNKALLDCQQAHLQTLRAIPMEARSLCAERARIFRALFTSAEIN